MTTDALTPEARTLLDADGCVRLSLPCLQCDYDLRTLPGDGRCPECGVETATSLAAYRELAAERWTRHLIDGLGMMTVGTALIALGPIFGFLAAVAGADMACLMVVFPLIGLPLTILGLVVTTSPPPDNVGDTLETRRATRQALTTALLAVVVSVMGLVLMVVLAPCGVVLVLGAAVGFCVAAVGTWVAVVKYVSELLPLRHRRSIGLCGRVGAGALLLPVIGVVLATLGALGHDDRLADVGGALIGFGFTMAAALLAAFAALANSRLRRLFACLTERDGASTTTATTGASEP